MKQIVEFLRGTMLGSKKTKFENDQFLLKIHVHVHVFTIDLLKLTQVNQMKL